MNFLSNITSSISGSIDKALLCVKKPQAVEVNNRLNSNALLKDLPTSKRTLVKGAVSNVDLRAKLVASQKGFISSFSNVESIAKTQGYHVMQVKYNPSSIRLYAQGGHQMMPGPGGVGVNMQVQSVIPAMTTMHVQLLFDDVNPQDAFMFDKFSNLSAGAVVSDVAGVVKNVRQDGYSVQKEIEALIALLLQSESRQIVFYWGDMVFAGEIINMNASYTMFNPQGNPIRGVVDMTIREGGPDGDSSSEEYWDDAYKRLLQSGGLMDKLGSMTGNLLNLK